MPEDYGLWSTIYDLKISDGGSWCHYRLSYDSGKDTLFVKSTLNDRTYSFADGHDGQFNGDKWFGCLMDNKFELTHLSKGNRKSFDNTDSFAFAGNGQYVLMHFENNGKHNFVARNLDTGKEIQIADAEYYTVSPDTRMVAVAVKGQERSKLIAIKLDKSAAVTEVIESTDESYSTIVWQDNSQSFAFASVPNGSKQAVAVSLYKPADQKLFCFDTRIVALWPEERILSCHTSSSIAISADGLRVFFSTVKKPSVKPSEKAVEIWNAQDKDLWHYRMRGWNSSSKEVAWMPEAGEFVIIGTENQITGKVSGDHRHMLTYDTTPYKPSLKQVADRDIYIMDLQDGDTAMLLKRQFGEYDDMQMSPDGKFVCYFREGNWWAYDINQKTHRNLSSNVMSEFAAPYFQTPMVPIPFGLAAWASDAQSVLLYDAYDIWEVSLYGNPAQRLTDGRKDKIVYRISEAMFDSDSGGTVKFPMAHVVDIHNYLVLEGSNADGSGSGFYRLKHKGKIQCLLSGKNQNSKAVQSKNGILVFIQEDYDSPPCVVTLNMKTGLHETIYRSNPQHDSYGWGKSELLTYQNERGEKRTAVLFYPFDYDPAKRYPMIVKVYEDLMYTLHKYVNPSLHNGDGYNTTNFTGNGYFVLHPNIVYENGNRGLSAAKCIVDAVEAASSYVPIDKKSIGLIGHSFGGYETFFTITQTTKFAAAVAGAGVSDITTSYLSMGWNFSRPETWRYEFEQGGMGKALYDSPDSYRDNSGITYADKVQTPLLSWTGANDPEVDPSQSMEFYMALRRLGKVHVMLRYPDEGHSLLKPENEIDLTTKIMQWFDHFLKGKEKPVWSNAH